MLGRERGCPHGGMGGASGRLGAPRGACTKGGGAWADVLLLHSFEIRCFSMMVDFFFQFIRTFSYKIMNLVTAKNGKYQNNKVFPKDYNGKLELMQPSGE